MKRVEPYASAAQESENPRKTTSINSLSQDELGIVFGFLVGTRLEDVVPLAEVSKAFNVAAKKPILIWGIQISMHSRFDRMEDKDEARAKLLEYLSLISSHYVGITSVDLGSDSEDDRVFYFNNEHVQMLSNFPLLKTLDLSRCCNVTDVRPLLSLTTLEEPNLRNTRINDAGLRAISTSLTRLTKLSLRSCRSITGAGFACLSSLSSLQDLNVCKTRINDEGLRVIDSLPAIHTLDLRGCLNVSA